MGSSQRAVCGCGYQTSVRIGGNRLDFHENSSFPFLCAKCGVVNVNIAKPERVCPFCASSTITQYGISPASLPWEGFPHLQWREYKAHSEGNRCPQCQQYTLVFKSPDFFFD